MKFKTILGIGFLVVLVVTVVNLISGNFGYAAITGACATYLLMSFFHEQM